MLGKQGLKGTLRVALLSDFPAQLRRRKTLYVGETFEPAEVASVRVQGEQAFVQLVSVDTPEAASALLGQLLYVRRDEAAKLPRGQHYWHEIVGLRAVTRDGRELGQVAEILRTGANDVYVVQGPLGELLIPAIRDVVKRVDVGGGTLTVELLPGLLPGED